MRTDVTRRTLKVLALLGTAALVGCQCDAAISSMKCNVDGSVMAPATPAMTATTKAPSKAPSGSQPATSPAPRTVTVPITCTMTVKVNGKDQTEVKKDTISTPIS